MSNGKYLYRTREMFILFVVVWIASIVDYIDWKNTRKGSNNNNKIPAKENAEK